MAEPKRQLINVAIICNNGIIKEWEKNALLNLLINDNIKITSIINSNIDNNIKLNKNIIFNLFLKMLNNSKAYIDNNINEIVKDVKYININKDFNKLNELNIDLVINFSSKEIGDIINKYTQCKIFTFYFNDENLNQFDLICYNKIMNYIPEIKVNLTMLENDTYKVIKEGIFRLELDKYSVNLDNILFECAKWLTLIIDYSSFRASSQKFNFDIIKLEYNQKLGFLNICKFIIQLLYRKIKIFFSPSIQWNIGVIKSPIQNLLTDDEFIINWLPSQKEGIFIADPFGVIINNEIYIYYEYYSYKNQKENILYIKYNPNLKYPEGKLAIKENYNMSYPYIFEYENKIYCMPEMANANEISIYEMKDTDNWLKIKTIINNIKAYDPSIIQYNGYWWLFFTSNKDYFLNLWYSKDIFGDWTPHKKNPVKINPHSSRPGGTFFIYNGELYRPTQDGSFSYGSKIVINKILKLSPDDFEEQEYKTISPKKNSKYSDGLHTISSVGNFTLVDGLRNYRSIHWIIERFWRFFLKFLHFYK